MWNAAFSIALSIVAFIIALTIGLMAFGRRKRTLMVFGASYLLIALAFLLYPLHASLGPIAGFVLPNLLLMIAVLFLAWGTRTFYRKTPQWPSRFWFYLVVHALIILSNAHSGSDRRWSVISSSAIIIILTIEFLHSLSNRDFTSIQPRVRIPILISFWVFILVHVLRIVFTVALSITAPDSPMPSWLDTFTILSSLVSVVFWAGVIVMIYIERLIMRMEEKNAQLEQMALKDHLTGVLNRYSLETFLDTELERQDRYLEPLSFILLDIDHFKQVNDTWGHEMGDRVLIMVAGLIREEIRTTDRVFRWGGEEFLIVIPHTDSVGATGLAEKLRLKIAFTDLSAFDTMTPEFGGVTVSIGVTERMPGESRDDCFRRVDAAMYRAKNNGRNRVETTRTESPLGNHVVIEWKVEWESGLREIDDEHRVLIQRGNRLLNLSIANPSPQLLIQAMDSFDEHIRTHFRHEEQLLASIHYPKLAAHRKIHESLQNDTDEIRKQMTRGIVDPSTLFHFLVDRVLVSHMLEDDSDFFPLARKWVSDAEGAKETSHDVNVTGGTGGGSPA